jgi:hypothetical protein
VNRLVIATVQCDVFAQRDHPARAVIQGATLLKSASTTHDLAHANSAIVIRLSPVPA